jgi:predicted nucleic acid-binding protein
MWVFDATPLIYLAKVQRLDTLGVLDNRRVVPERVFQEVVTTGLDQGYPDARRIERAVESGQFDVRPAEDIALLSRLQTNTSLSDADAAVLALAFQHDGVAVMDEGYGRDVAASEGVTTRGTAYLVVKLASDGVITATAARETIDAMIEEGWYCAPDVYARIVQVLESLP